MPGPFDLELREPTGLPMGEADPLTIAQRLYEGRLAPTVEWREPGGAWRRLEEHPWLNGVARLVQGDRGPARASPPATRARFGGWRSADGEGSPAAAGPEPGATRPDRDRPASAPLGAAPAAQGEGEKKGALGVLGGLFRKRS